MKLSKIAFRNISRNIKRSFLSGLAIAIAAMSIVLLYSYISGMKKDLENNLYTYYTGQVRIQHKDFEKYDYLNPLHLRIENYNEVIEQVESVEGIKEISPRIIFPAQVYMNEETFNTIVTGVDLEKEVHYQPLEESLLKGRLPEQGKNEIIIGEKLASDLGLSVEDKISLWTMTMRRSSNLITYLITGIVKFPVQGINKMIVMAIDRAHRLIKMDDSVLEIIMKLDNGVSGIKIAEELRILFNEAGMDQLLVQPLEEINTSYTFVKLGEVTYDFVTLFFFILASSVIVSTTMMVIFERMKEIGTIGALGMTGPEIVKLFFLEAFFISVIGTFFGVISGILISIPLQIYGVDLSSAIGNMDFEISGIIKFQLNLKSTLFVFIYSISIASLASLVPSIRASKIEPVEALRDI